MRGEVEEFGLVWSCYYGWESKNTETTDLECFKLEAVGCCTNYVP